MELTGSLVADIELLLSVGILLCLFSYLVVRLPAIGLACFMFLVLTRAHEYIPHSEVFRPSVLVGMIMLVGLFFYLLINRQPLYFTGLQSLLVVTFIAFSWILLFIKGQTIYDRKGYFLFEPLLLAVVAFFATLNAVRSLRDFRIVLLTLVLIDLTISVLTIAQSFFTGVMHGLSWAYVSAHGAVTRAGSLGIDPNEVAVVLTTLLPLLFFLLDNEKTLAFRKAVYLFCILLTILTVFLTYSRGGFICLIAAFFLIFKKRLNAKYVLGFVALLIGIFILVPSAFWERLASTGTTDTTGQGRLIIWQAALNMIQAHPLTGIGYGQFYYAYSQYGGQGWEAIASHNTYLGIAAETGLVGLLIFLGLFWVTFLDLRRLKHGVQHLADDWMVKISDAFSAILITTLISGLTIERRTWILLYVFLALVIVLKRIGRQSHVTIPITTRRR